MFVDKHPANCTVFVLYGQRDMAAHIVSCLKTFRLPVKGRYRFPFIATRTHKTTNLLSSQFFPLYSVNCNESLISQNVVTQSNVRKEIIIFLLFIFFYSFPYSTSKCMLMTEENTVQGIAKDSFIHKAKQDELCLYMNVTPGQNIWSGFICRAILIQCNQQGLVGQATVYQFTGAIL